MIPTTLRPYFHPTTIVMVDDNQRFLDNFSLLLHEDLACRFFSSATEALAFLNRPARRTHLGQRCFSHLNPAPGNPRGDRVLRLDLTLIEQEISNPERFHDVSVVVVDYQMPDMTGLEFCRQLRNPSIKKVLLTGVAGEDVAIEAFNQGIIHQFLTKTDPHITERIHQTLDQLQQRYFEDISTLIQSTLALEPPDFLVDPGFADYFARLCREHQIVEYYYVEDPAGFLMVSRQGQLSRLLVYGEQDCERTLFNLRPLNPPAAVLRQLLARKAVPWLWSTPEDYDDQEPFDWNDFIHPATTVTGRRPWYCSLVASPPADIEYDPDTACYRAYLDQLDRE